MCSVVTKSLASFICSNGRLRIAPRGNTRPLGDGLRGEPGIAAANAAIDRRLDDAQARARALCCCQRAAAYRARLVAGHAAARVLVVESDHLACPCHACNEAAKARPAGRSYASDVFPASNILRCAEVGGELFVVVAEKMFRRITFIATC